MQSEGSESSEPIRKFSLSSLSNSLRWRQLATSLVIIATGISGVGALYYYFQTKASLDEQGQQMSKNGQDILVSIRLQKELELFLIDNEVVTNKEFEEFLSENKFTVGDVERDIDYFGYYVTEAAQQWSQSKY